MSRLRDSLIIRFYYLRREINYLRSALADEKNKSALISCADIMAKRERAERKVHDPRLLEE
jgi:hypothetical protein